MPRRWQRKEEVARTPRARAWRGLCGAEGGFDVGSAVAAGRLLSIVAAGDVHSGAAGAYAEALAAGVSIWWRFPKGLFSKTKFGPKGPSYIVSAIFTCWSTKWGWKWS